MGDEARHEDEIELALAMHLVGDAHPVGIRIAGANVALLSHTLIVSAVGAAAADVC